MANYPDFYPGAKYVGSPFYSSRDDFAPEAIVIHIMDGTLKGCDSWFNDKEHNTGRVSAHFGVDKLGEVHQYVYLSNAAHANGGIENWQLPLIVENNYQNPNDWTISIEHEGVAGDIPTQPQLTASARLSAWLYNNVLFKAGANGVAVDRKHVLKHQEITPNLRPLCPGWNEALMATYVDMVRLYVTQGNAPIRTYEQGRIDTLNELAAIIASMR